MGWVVTKRTRKHFHSLNWTGSALNGLQIIVDNTVPNYDETIALAGTGFCSIVGRIVASQGAKQRIEVPDLLEIIGTVPETYPLPKKRQGPGCPFKCPYPCTHKGRGDVDTRSGACAQAVRSLETTISLYSYANHHSQWLRRRCWWNVEWLPRLGKSA